MDGYVRLENRRIVPTRQIANYCLKKGARRLGRNKPVRDDGLFIHEAGIGCSSIPLLQLYYVPLGIARINDAKEADAVDLSGGNLSHHAAPCCDHGL